jgi:hypothetical protein
MNRNVIYCGIFAPTFCVYMSIPVCTQLQNLSCVYASKTLVAIKQGSTVNICTSGNPFAFELNCESPD